MKKTLATFVLTEKKHDIVRRAAKKLKISQSAVMRLRVKSNFNDMIKALEEDMKHADHIDLNRY